MLEKIGLPAKPSLRGSNWVVDASHCQGCSSQFTFLNRKHHCRRCGGIFCNGCTQQRVILRGQGDSPVRICEPCKKLEEAARFELRHGHKSKAGRGTSKPVSRGEDDVLNQLLANSVNESTGARSSSSSQEVTPLDGEALGSIDDPGGALGEVGSATPEDLRRQAMDEKNNYKILKAEGKSAEALKAFKRGKELERQAAALELLLRKNRRKALVSGSMDEMQTNEDHPQESEGRNKLSTEKGKVKPKDDLTAELKALGWSDMDIHNAEQKPTHKSVESELFNLVGESSKTPDPKRSSHGIDKKEVIELKKKALSLKREGKLTEAKEELKKAKILEKQLEEQEFLADAEDSDDEISALIRVLDSGKQHDVPTTGFDLGSGFDFDNFAGFSDDLTADVKLEVTDDDMNDPEISAALTSLGWTDESNKPDIFSPPSASFDREALANEVGPKQATKSRLMIQRELLVLKKKARALRTEGKVTESEEELKKCNVLEQQLEEMDNAANTKVVQVSADTSSSSVVVSIVEGGDDDDDVTDHDMHDPAYLKLLRGLGWQDEDLERTNPATEMPNQDTVVSLVGITDSPPSILKKPRRRSKAEVQRELLSLKRKARAMRSQGQAAEAEELLEKAKALESEIAILDGDSEQMAEPPNKSVVIVEEMKHETSEPLLYSPKDDDKEEMEQAVHPTIHEVNPSPQEMILGHKRKALALKREGKLTEARGELRKARLLEGRLEEEIIPKAGDDSTAIEVPTSLVGSSSREEHDPPNVAPRPISSQDRFKLQRQCLTHKRNALKLRREGRVEESEGEQRLANALEAQLEETAGRAPKNKNSSSDDVMVDDLLDPQLLSALKAIGIQDAHGLSNPPPDPAEASTLQSKKIESSSHERIQLETQIKAEKMKAINLKQSGKKAEAIEALRRAKQLEKKLDSLPS
ncbi:hypothetical protein Dimus_032870 [Dionaea muscipula]